MLFTVSLLVVVEATRAVLPGNFHGSVGWLLLPGTTSTVVTVSWLRYGRSTCFLASLFLLAFLTVNGGTNEPITVTGWVS